MDRVYRRQRHIYDFSRKYYLLGRDRLVRDLTLAAGKSRVLEIGCGTARNSIRIAERYPSTSALRPRRLGGNAENRGGSREPRGPGQSCRAETGPGRGCHARPFRPRSTLRSRILFLQPLHDSGLARRPDRRRRASSAPMDSSISSISAISKLFGNRRSGRCGVGSAFSMWRPVMNCFRPWKGPKGIRRNAPYTYYLGVMPSCCGPARRQSCASPAADPPHSSPVARLTNASAVASMHQSQEKRLTGFSPRPYRWNQGPSALVGMVSSRRMGGTGDVSAQAKRPEPQHMIKGIQ